MADHVSELGLYFPIGDYNYLFSNGSKQVSLISTTSGVGYEDTIIESFQLNLDASVSAYQINLIYNDVLEFSSNVLFRWLEVMDDEVDFSSPDLLYTYTVALADRLGFFYRLTAGTAQTDSITEALIFTDQALFLAREIIREDLTLDDALGGGRALLLELIDVVQFQDQSLSRVEAIERVVAALLLTDRALYQPLESLLDEVHLTGRFTSLVRALAAIDEQITLSDEASGALRLWAALPETFTLEEGIDARAQFLASLRDHCTFFARVYLQGPPPLDPDDPTRPDPDVRGWYAAWAVNTETGAPSEYRGIPFNSYATVRDRHLALTHAGLYEMQGEDDDGFPIEAAVRTGLLDFGSRVLKNVPYAYLGYTATGRLLLKVLVSDVGSKRAYVYELVEKDNTTFTEGRVKLGKGLKSRYWAFELSNVDGADFDLDIIEPMVLRLSRRIRG